MVLAVPLALVIALLLVELAPPWLSRVVGTAIELLAAVPSIVFGMWGFFVLVPLMSNHVEPGSKARSWASCGSSRARRMEWAFSPPGSCSP